MLGKILQTLIHSTSDQQIATPRFRNLVGFGVVALVALSFCKTPNSARMKGANDLPLSADTISSWEQFKAMSRESSGVLQNGRTIKFLIDQRDPAKPHVYFINGNFRAGGDVPDYAKYHYYFAQKKLAIMDDLNEFNSHSYFTEKKLFVAGTMQSYNLSQRAKPVVSIQLYPQDVIHGKSMLTVAQTLFAQIKLPDFEPAFVQTGQQQAIEDAMDGFKNAKIEFLTLDQILGGTNYVMLNSGEAYGYLRLFPRDQDSLSPKDIAVFDDLPLDLSVVSGVLTKTFQDTNSHINLKSKERGTPNAVVRDISTNSPLVQGMVDKPVHMVVTNDAVQITPSTAADVDRWFAKHMDKPWRPVSVKSSKNLLSYDEMCPGSPADCFTQAYVYGSKASNLGFLSNNAVLGRIANGASAARSKLGLTLEPVPYGFGIPLQFYIDLVNYPANAPLKATLNEFVTAEKSGNLTSAQRKQWVEKIQKLFFTAKSPPDNLKAIAAKTQTILPGIKKIKIRSSAKAEDIEGFDGAGLHDSYSAKSDEADAPDEICAREVENDAAGAEVKAKMSPRTLACAIKGAYASLWNKRAIEERSFARMDHATVSMGVSVLPSYDYQSKIKANAVIVTRVINNDHVYGYSLSVQQGDNLVTNPDAGTYSETSIAAFIGDEPTSFSMTRLAKPKANGPVLTAPILDKVTMDKIVHMARHIEHVYCVARGKSFYKGNCAEIEYDLKGKDKSLDMELKILENGQIVLKQIREFSGK